VPELLLCLSLLALAGGIRVLADAGIAESQAVV